MSKKGANQYGRYIWQPSDKSRQEAKYSARVNLKGFTVRASCDNKDELVEDLKELIDRVQPLVKEESGNEKED